MSMNKTVERIIAEALNMGPDERAYIVEQLISSLDIQADPDVEVFWQQEVQRRISEIEKGQVICIPWEEVRERLRRRSSAPN